MKRITCLITGLLAITAILSACAGSRNSSGTDSPASGSRSLTLDARSDSAAFVTRLGADTLAVERFIIWPDRVRAEVALRTPSTSLAHYEMTLSGDKSMGHLETAEIDPRTGAQSQRQTLRREGDSLRITTWQDGAERTRAVSADARTLPFIDMVHWPYELALMRVRAASSTLLTQPLLTGARVAPFEIATVGTDSMTITHPTRGTMRLRVDAKGRLLSLDAGQTTRALLVERRPWGAVDPAAVAAGWKRQDGAGRSFGALSGRGSDTVAMHGATIVVDYGRPVKRGREIWGSLVKYDVVWRTGANEATHFTTSREIVLDPAGARLVVPAGAYTLFSIPRAEGGTLIVNSQTGQGGQGYDASRDLGRVPLIAR
ncbi:MAG: DUF2911 domain-containing protein, partial [Anaerolineae bacterium]|nr:DUF2911 domain-containing protein [Gemmatimonadaceae bacterium]